MKKFGLLSTSAISSAALFAFAAPAYAEDAAAAQPNCTPEQAAAGTCTLPTTDANGAPADSSSAIVVTGSRIRRPNLESTIPITSVSGEQFFQQGNTNVGDTLNDLPQLRSTFAQQNPGLGIGIAGLNLLDLRGLGTQRTLVLVNGRRHVPADILNNAVSVDINTIPNDLIERVDIVTGGNSAIYGSDAIAGVVNFVLRRDYDGIQIRGNAAITGAGFGGNQYISAMVGHNFADGRGNITLHGEYAHQERIYASDVPWYTQNNSLQVVDADSGGLVNNSDGVPDRVFVRDVRSASIHFRGLVPINQRQDNAATPAFESGACGNGILANNGGPNSLGNPYNCTYIFTADGRLVQQTGARFGTGIIGGIAGGNGQTGREGQTISVLPVLERYNFNLLAHYEFSPAFELFAEAKWNRVNALGNNAGPSFNQGTSGTGDFRERPRLDNPFLNPADRTTLANLILASGCRTDLLVVCPAAGNLTATDIANIANGSFRFVDSRNLLDVGLRDEHFNRDTWRVVGGLRGTFNDDWSYEVSVNYGKFREDITTDGFIDRQRFSLAMDAGRDATGAIRCRSQFDPASAVQLQPPAPGTNSATVNAANAARLAADIAACVPYNPFGTPDNRASVAYFSREFTAHSGLDQLVLSGFVSGDLSQLFELPGGPISFALGAEYRRENAFYHQDQFVTDGFTNGVSIPSFDPNTFTVKEAFAEIRIPILHDMPFFQELTASGAARVARYQGGTGTVWAYNAGLDWAPVRDIRFRGNYSRAVRAPNVSETAFPLVPNFSPGFVDPCNPAVRNQANNRAANCLAQLGATLLAGLTDVTQSLAIVSGSNPNLTAETSDSWTLGVVLQPRWIPGLNISVDYYDITVDGIITSIAAQTIVNSCYDSPTLNNIFCTAFSRNLTNATNSTGDGPGRIVSNSLIVAPLNFARRVRRGIDVQAGYRTNLGPDVRLNANLIYTHNLKISNFQDPTNPTFENQVLGETGDPFDEFRLDVDLSHGPFTFGYRLHYIGPQWVSNYEDFNPLNGLPPANADFAAPQKLPAVYYHDIRFEWNVLGGQTTSRQALNVYFGVDNVLDRHPPLGILATGAGPGAVGSAAIYGIRGRNFYGGFRARF